MLNTEWRPSWMEKTEKDGEKIQHSQDGYVSSSDAEHRMVLAQEISERWADHYANATYFKEAARFKRDSAFQIAFLKSEAKSDKQKEADAKQDPLVKSSEFVLMEATAALKFAELRYDGAVRAYHAFKKILENAHEERKFL